MSHNSSCTRLAKWSQNLTLKMENQQKIQLKDTPMMGARKKNQNNKNLEERVCQTGYCLGEQGIE